MTPEERKAWGEKMKASREAAAAAREAKKNIPAVEENPTNLSNDDVQALLRRVRELEDNFKMAETRAQAAERQNGVQGAPQITNRAQMVGSFEKYITDKAYYPDPRERLANEPRLQRFAFPINYELSWNVTTTQYQTLDGLNVREPRFTVELIKIVMDEETGEPTNGRYVLRTCMLHEDPDAALEIARQEGIEVGDDHKAFLDEMRYLRIRDWLLEAFYPKPSTTKKDKKEMVIGNRVVQFYEVNSQDSQTIPFGDLQGKV